PSTVDEGQGSTLWPRRLYHGAARILAGRSGQGWCPSGLRLGGPRRLLAVENLPSLGVGELELFAQALLVTVLHEVADDLPGRHDSTRNERPPGACRHRAARQEGRPLLWLVCVAQRAGRLRSGDAGARGHRRRRFQSMRGGRIRSSGSPFQSTSNPALRRATATSSPTTCLPAGSASRLP